MKWIKHDTDAHLDAKMRRLVMRHGMEAYGLYWYCLELIAREVGKDKLTFELEHDAEIIAHDVRMGREQVESMMRSMVELGLFEASHGRITCLKLLDRIDLSQGGSAAFRKAVSDRKSKALARKSHDTVMTESADSHDSVKKQSALEVDVEVDLEVSKTLDHSASDRVRSIRMDFEQFWSAYPRKVGKPKAQAAFHRHIRDPQTFATVMTNIAERIRVGEWDASHRKQYIPHPTTWINRQGWNDDITPPPTPPSSVNIGAATNRAQEIIDQLRGGFGDGPVRLN